MSALPDPLRNAAATFDSLPGVGPRAALRYAYWLMTQPKDVILRFARSLEGLASGIQACTTCHQWADRSLCAICADGKRDASVLCVVATSQDVQSLEDTGVYHGRYHVLGGLLDPIEGRTPERLFIASLLARLKNSDSTVSEIIFALDTNIQGDTTTLYLRKQFEGLPIKTTRLARGLPTGAALEYADALTLADAITHRQ